MIKIAVSACVASLLFACSNPNCKVSHEACVKEKGTLVGGMPCLTCQDANPTLWNVLQYGQGNPLDSAYCVDPNTGIKNANKPTGMPRVCP